MTDLDAVLSELDQFFVTERRQPGDADAKTLADRYGLSINAARDTMHKIVKQHPDRFQIVEIREDGHAVKVLRKVSQ